MTVSTSCLAKLFSTLGHWTLNDRPSKDKQNLYFLIYPKDRKLNKNKWIA